MYIAIAGNIGVGKSTLTRILAQRYRLSPAYEAVEENPYLADFYKDMPRYAFHSQVFFLSKRLEQHLNYINSNPRVIQDRTIFEDAHIFARNLHEQGIMNTRDFASYMQLFNALSTALKVPDLLVYLQASSSTLKERIAKRGRDYESDISTAYLAQLNSLYEAWVKDYSLSPVVYIDANRLDFVNHEADLQEIFSLLEQRGLRQPLL